ncbi:MULTISPECIES: ABC transporter substrate-binding protein [unclassified Arthrobacter]|uniref:ABC transporter substrate-binding protein n=1 Tax=unclassified Arthrobacter TaxID=235627 RepID=UPI000368875F|nr:MULTISPECIES: sugar ABC transporter substrate-binding protein [unclassified Arthrobacter]BCW54348.1 sugar ABC transporter substrate-binding protein [Arthrobacter sp. StoSoilB19]
MKNLRFTKIAASSLSAVFTAALLTACTGAGGSGGTTGDVTLNLATPSFSQMKDMEKLAPEFEKSHPGIKVKFTFLEESDLRDAVTKDVATKGGQYDVVTIGAYETPIWAANGWLSDIGARAEKTDGYDVNDIFQPVRDGSSYEGKMYSAPFYSESSFLMYRKDLFEAAGLTMPAHPTWDQVASLAATLNDPAKGVSGIILRGKPGWGESLAPLNTVVNTFGGQWFDKDWNAKLTSPAFTEATKFYVNLLKSAGQPDPVSYGFAESLNLFTQGKAAMWYDSTSAGGVVEDPATSKIAGKVGYVHAPTKKTAESGWFWSWNLAIPATSKKQDAAWDFISWATSKEYVKLVGEKIGWTQAPPGTRESTYSIPEYLKAAGSFAPLTKEVMLNVNTLQPGTEPQNWVGVQYVGIPEFQDIGNQISQGFADVISGKTDVDTFLANSEKIAQAAGDAHK